MKKTFCQYEQPLLTAMILCRTPEECVEKIQASLEKGAEAFGVQLCQLKREYRTEQHIKQIFAACTDKPIYVTSYRYAESQGMTDEECAELLLLALKCGATLLDIMGNLFDRDAEYEISFQPEAVQKQKELIAEIHRRGGEVLMSSHTHANLSQEENLRIARAHAERGADVVKIVGRIDREDELGQAISQIAAIREAIQRPLLFLLGECGRLIRYIGPKLGVCMYLCVERHGSLDTPMQPLLEDAKAAREHIRI